MTFLPYDGAKAIRVGRSGTSNFEFGSFLYYTFL